MHLTPLRYKTPASGDARHLQAHPRLPRSLAERCVAHQRALSSSSKSRRTKTHYLLPHWILARVKTCPFSRQPSSHVGNKAISRTTTSFPRGCKPSASLVLFRVTSSLHSCTSPNVISRRYRAGSFSRGSQCSHRVALLNVLTNAPKCMHCTRFSLPATAHCLNSTGECNEYAPTVSRSKAVSWYA